MKRIIRAIISLTLLSAPLLASVTIISPAGGETWIKGKTSTLRYSFSEEMGTHMVKLYKNGSFLGYVRVSDYPYDGNVVINYPWVVGKISTDTEEEVWVPCGSGYTVDIGVYGGTQSNPFTIGYDFAFIGHFKQFVAVPKPGCPECFVLDLKELREELIKLDDLFTVGLYWRNEKIANFGKIGKGQAWPGKQEIWLQPAPKTSMSRGGEFELRIFTDHHELIHSQPVVLVVPNR